MDIGKRVKEVLFEQGRSACWLASQIPCERTNVYDIFKRQDMNVKLLAQLSIVLQHDFFAELSHEIDVKGQQ